LETVENISKNAQYDRAKKYFSHPRLGIYPFSTPPIKLKLGLQIGERLLIAKYLDRIIMIGQSKTWNSS
jgi:hypothetical protein